MEFFNQNIDLPLHLLNIIQVLSILCASGVIRKPFATPLWKRGHKFMLAGVSIWFKSTVVPLGGALPVKQSGGAGSGSVMTGVAVRNVNIPLK